MKLSEILDSVMLESGMDTETAYAAADEGAVRRLVNLANRSVELLSRYQWQALRKTHTFTLTTATTYQLPADFRSFVPDTMYTDSHLWAVDFPTNAGEWAYLQASAGGSGIRTQLRLLGNQIQIYQPNSGETIRVEYVSKYPVQAADESYKQRFTADDDTSILDDDLVTRDIIWRYKKLMAVPDWQADLMEFRAYERVLKGQEAGAQTIRPEHDGGGYGSPYYDLWRPVPNT